MMITTERSYAATVVCGIIDPLMGKHRVLFNLKRAAMFVSALIAVGIWLVPGLGWESDMMVFKFAVSVMGARISAAFHKATRPSAPPKVEVDIAAAEVRLIRANARSHSSVIERYAFTALDYVELNGRTFTFWTKGEQLLVEMTLSNATAHASLLGALRAVGKLVCTSQARASVARS